jgi:hypothetical protein
VTSLLDCFREQGQSLWEEKPFLRGGTDSTRMADNFSTIRRKKHISKACVDFEGPGA